VYGSNCRIERQELDLWLRKEAVTDTPREMLDFSEGIEDLEFVDPALFGGTFTWNKANNLGVASSLRKLQNMRRQLGGRDPECFGYSKETKTQFFPRMANAHKRSNIIDKLEIKWRIRN
ncbi:hypothetical protein MTR67_006750, partial [Solanum verrucosum]